MAHKGIHPRVFRELAAIVAIQILCNIFMNNRVRSSALSASLWMTPCSVGPLIHWKEGILCRGTLTGLRSWTHVNLMKLNNVKCMTLHPRQGHSKFQYRLQDELIASSPA